MGPTRKIIEPDDVNRLRVSTDLRNKWWRNAAMCCLPDYNHCKNKHCRPRCFCGHYNAFISQYREWIKHRQLSCKLTVLPSVLAGEILKLKPLTQWISHTRVSFSCAQLIYLDIQSNVEQRNSVSISLPYALLETSRFLGLAENSD